MTNSNPFILLRRLICIPRCASCHKRLSPIIQKDLLNHGKICLCEKCIQKWQSAKSDLCHSCYFTADKCSCGHSKFSNFDQPSFPSLCFYRPNDDSIQNRMIYTLKHRQDCELFEFLACELSPKITHLMAKENISSDSLLFSWVPRKRSSAIKYGFDQGEYLCRKVAKRLGAGVIELFSRRGEVEQKSLTASRRRKNMRESISISKKASVQCHKYGADNLETLLKEKTVVLVDDIITSGATLSHAKKLLDAAGASRVIAVSVARCEKDNGKI